MASVVGDLSNVMCPKSANILMKTVLQPFS